MFLYKQIKKINIIILQDIMKNKFFCVKICSLIFIGALALSACGKTATDGNDIYVTSSSDTSDNSGIIKNDYNCVKSEEISGIIKGSVTVSDNATLTLSGIISKGVNVEKNSKLICEGIVNGNITGNGYVDITGVVKGTVAETLKGIIHKDAYINGTQCTEDIILN